jgi:hypothetical protein
MVYKSGFSNTSRLEVVLVFVLGRIGVYELLMFFV